LYSVTRTRMSRRVSYNSAVSYNSRRTSYSSAVSYNSRRVSCNSEISVPHNIDMQSIVSDVSDLQEENAQNNGTWRKHFQFWQHQNASRWNSSSDRERRDRLKTCLNNVAQIDSNMQGHDLQVKRKIQSRRRRASLRKTENDVHIQEQRIYVDENIQKVRKSKKSERENIKQSISNDKGLKMKSGWVEPIIEEKPTAKALSSFIEKKIRAPQKEGGPHCDNGAFSLWSISRAA